MTVFEIGMLGERKTVRHYADLLTSMSKKDGGSFVAIGLGSLDGRIGIAGTLKLNAVELPDDYRVLSERGRRETERFVVNKAG